MFAPVWEGVVKGRYASVKARVNGYARYAVEGEAYPGCIVQAGAAVEGQIYLDVSLDDVRALDAFEGSHYARHRVLAHTSGTQSIDCWIYIYLQTQHLSKRAWDAQHFEQVTMARFKATYVPTGT
jgi:gamma-glutamylcyclotransferase (GGCT)/AIG2-like uncharacterized protein YtfP